MVKYWNDLTEVNDRMYRTQRINSVAAYVASGMRCAACTSIFFAISIFAQSWQQLPDFPGTARDDAAAFSNNCKVFVGTGMEVGWTLTNDWWRYDMVQYSWQQVASLPSTPRQYCTGRAIGGVGFLFGGLDAAGPLSELWAYDTTTDTWAARSPLPSEGRYAASSFEANSKLYVCGGLIAGGAAQNELWEYDPLTDQWMQRSSLPGVPRHRAAGISDGLNGSTGRVVGGADINYVALDEVWQYDPATDVWTAQLPLPEARYGLSASSGYEPMIMAGAVDNNTFRSDGFFGGAVAWYTFPVGSIPDGRRGGVMGDSDQCSGWNHSFYGLGLDGTNTRRKDWHSTGYWFGIEEQLRSDISVFPNPAIDHIQLGIDPGFGVSAVTIYDASGQAVAQRPLPSSGSLKIEELSAGPYLLRVTSSNRTRTGHFIKLPE